MPIITLPQLKSALPRAKRLMGIDHSKVVLGLALSNPDLTIATPLAAIARTKFKEDVVQLAKICREYDVAGFVIGLPLNMDGSEGPRTESVRHFSDNLMAAETALGFAPLIAFFDERLSTHAAEDFLHETAKLSRDKSKGTVDKIAAQMILQAALDRL